MRLLATLARVYVDDLYAALPTFVRLTGRQPGLRFSHRDLEVASVGDFLLLAGTPESLAPFRGTHATAIVDSVFEVLDDADRHGGEILAGPNEVPTGRNLTVRHPGGAIIEYVEFTPAARTAHA